MTECVWKFGADNLGGHRMELAHPLGVMMAPVLDYELADAHVLEVDVEQLHGRRRRSYVAGRYCAIEAQTLLGLEPSPVLREERVPVWPHGLRGSISHTDDIAMAAVSDRLKAVGIDVEHTDRVTAKIYDRVMTSKEQDWVQQHGSHTAAIVFSAKEAAYKALYPLNQDFIGFHEAEINIDLAAGQFRFNYLGEHHANRIADRGFGYWRQTDTHTSTIFVIP